MYVFNWSGGGVHAAVRLSIYNHHDVHGDNIYAQESKGTFFCQKVSFFIELNPSYNVQNLLKSKLQKLQRKSGTSTKCVMKKKNNSKIFLQRQMCRHHN